MNNDSELIFSKDYYYDHKRYFFLHYESPVRKLSDLPVGCFLNILLKILKENSDDDARERDYQPEKWQQNIENYDSTFNLQHSFL